MKKIIISSVIIVLVLIVGITTVVLALVPTGLNNTIKKPNEITIIYSKTKMPSDYYLTFRDRDSNDVDVIANIYSVFCHAFQQKVLTAIFNGEINDKIEENYLERGSNSIKNNSNEEEKMTICFKYSSKQKIKDYEYQYLFFEITNNNERKEIEFGVSSSFTANNSSYSYSYYYSGKANFGGLFAHIENLV